eukprot:symbB.v1.2.037529.t1/scaffold5570.1/size25768/4
MLQPGRLDRGEDMASMNVPFPEKLAALTSNMASDTSLREERMMEDAAAALSAASKKVAPFLRGNMRKPAASDASVRMATGIISPEGSGRPWQAFRREPFGDGPPWEETRNGPMSGELRMDVGSFMSCDTKKAKEHGFGVSEWTAPFSPRIAWTRHTPANTRTGSRFCGFNFNWPTRQQFPYAGAFFFPHKYVTKMVTVTTAQAYERHVRPGNLAPPHIQSQRGLISQRVQGALRAHAALHSEGTVPAAAPGTAPARGVPVPMVNGNAALERGQHLRQAKEVVASLDTCGDPTVMDRWIHHLEGSVHPMMEAEKIMVMLRSLVRQGFCGTDQAIQKRHSWSHSTTRCHRELWTVATPADIVSAWITISWNPSNCSKHSGRPRWTSCWQCTGKSAEPSHVREEFGRHGRA